MREMQPRPLCLGIQNTNRIMFDCSINENKLREKQEDAAHTLISKIRRTKQKIKNVENIVRCYCDSSCVQINGCCCGKGKQLSMLHSELLQLVDKI